MRIKDRKERIKKGSKEIEEGRMERRREGRREVRKDEKGRIDMILNKVICNVLIT